jgi:O-antigen ligase
LCLFLIWALVGYIINFYSHEFIINVTSAFFVYNVFQLLIVAALFSQPIWKGQRNKLILFFLFCSLCEVFIVILLEALANGGSLTGFHKPNGTYNHHGMLGCVLVLSFGVASSAVFELRDKREKAFSVCVAISCIGLLFLSGSRSVLLGIFLATPAVILLGFRHKWSTWAILLLSIPIAFIALRVLPVWNMAINAFLFSTSTGSPDMSAYGRLLIWERVYEHALYGPWYQKIVGIGVGTFNTLHFNYFLEVGRFTTGGHNNFFHAFVETGIVGLIIFLAIFVEIIRKLAIKCRNNDNAARCFLLCTLALLFSCLTQETFWFNPSFGRFWLLYISFYLILFNFSDNLPKGEKNELKSYVSDH